jgi:hypothetical protein
VCRRDISPACGPGPVCLTCQHLAPASAEQIAGLPAESDRLANHTLAVVEGYRSLTHLYADKA